MLPAPPSMRTRAAARAPPMPRRAGTGSRSIFYVLAGVFIILVLRVIFIDYGILFASHSAAAFKGGHGADTPHRQLHRRTEGDIIAAHALEVAAAKKRLNEAVRERQERQRRQQDQSDQAADQGSAGGTQQQHDADVDPRVESLAAPIATGAAATAEGHTRGNRHESPPGVVTWIPGLGPRARVFGVRNTSAGISGELELQLESQGAGSTKMPPAQGRNAHANSRGGAGGTGDSKRVDNRGQGGSAAATREVRYAPLVLRVCHFDASASQHPIGVQQGQQQQRVLRTAASRRLLLALERVQAFAAIAADTASDHHGALLAAVAETAAPTDAASHPAGANADGKASSTPGHAHQSAAEQRGAHHHTPRDIIPAVARISAVTLVPGSAAACDLEIVAAAVNASGAVDDFLTSTGRDQAVDESESFSFAVTPRAVRATPMAPIVLYARSLRGAIYGLRAIVSHVRGPHTTVSPDARKIRIPPLVVLDDAPALSAWRGQHVDIARHYHDAATLVDSVLRPMAWARLNTLHLHLADDQGWRMESLLLPSLHRYGSRRNLQRANFAHPPADPLQGCAFWNTADEASHDEATRLLRRRDKQPDGVASSASSLSEAQRVIRERLNVAELNGAIVGVGAPGGVAASGFLLGATPADSGGAEGGSKLAAGNHHEKAPAIHRNLDRTQHSAQAQGTTFSESVPASKIVQRRCYWTIEEMRAFALAAAARGVRVVPEVDLPSHAAAALLALEAENMLWTQHLAITAASQGMASSTASESALTSIFARTPIDGDSVNVTVARRWREELLARAQSLPAPASPPRVHTPMSAEERRRFTATGGATAAAYHPRSDSLRNFLRTDGITAAASALAALTVSEARAFRQRLSAFTAAAAANVSGRADPEVRLGWRDVLSLLYPDVLVHKTPTGADGTVYRRSGFGTVAAGNSQCGVLASLRRSARAAVSPHNDASRQISLDEAKWPGLHVTIPRDSAASDAGTATAYARLMDFMTAERFPDFPPLDGRRKVDQHLHADPSRTLNISSGWLKLDAAGSPLSHAGGSGGGAAAAGRHAAGGNSPAATGAPVSTSSSISDLVWARSLFQRLHAAPNCMGGTHGILDPTVAAADVMRLVLSELALHFFEPVEVALFWDEDGDAPRGNDAMPDTASAGPPAKSIVATRARAWWFTVHLGGDQAAFLRSLSWGRFIDARLWEVGTTTAAFEDMVLREPGAFEGSSVDPSFSKRVMALRNAPAIPGATSALLNAEAIRPESALSEPLPPFSYFSAVADAVRRARAKDAGVAVAYERSPLEPVVDLELLRAALLPSDVSDGEQPSADLLAFHRSSRLQRDFTAAMAFHFSTELRHYRSTDGVVGTGAPSATKEPLHHTLALPFVGTAVWDESFLETDGAAPPPFGTTALLWRDNVLTAAAVADGVRSLVESLREEYDVDGGRDLVVDAGGRDEAGLCAAAFFDIALGFNDASTQLQAVDAQVPRAAVADVCGLDDVAASATSPTQGDLSLVLYPLVYAPKTRLYFDYQQHAATAEGFSTQAEANHGYAYLNVLGPDAPTRAATLRRAWNVPDAIRALQLVLDTNASTAGIDGSAVANAKFAVASVVGVQGQVWTEQLWTGAALRYQILPRMLAVAEAGWAFPVAQAASAAHGDLTKVVISPPEKGADGAALGKATGARALHGPAVVLAAAENLLLFPPSSNGALRRPQPDATAKEQSTLRALLPHDCVSAAAIVTRTYGATLDRSDRRSFLSSLRSSGCHASPVCSRELALFLVAMEKTPLARADETLLAWSLAAAQASTGNHRPNDKNADGLDNVAGAMEGGFGEFLLRLHDAPQWAAVRETLFDPVTVAAVEETPVPVGDFLLF